MTDQDLRPVSLVVLCRSIALTIGDDSLTRVLTDSLEPLEELEGLEGPKGSSANPQGDEKP